MTPSAQFDPKRQSAIKPTSVALSGRCNPCRGLATYTCPLTSRRARLCGPTKARCRMCRARRSPTWSVFAILKTLDHPGGSTSRAVDILEIVARTNGLCACGNVSVVNSGEAWGAAHPGLDFPALSSTPTTARTDRRTPTHRSSVEASASTVLSRRRRTRSPSSGWSGEPARSPTVPAADPKAEQRAACAFKAGATPMLRICRSTTS